MNEIVFVTLCLEDDEGEGWSLMLTFFKNLLFLVHRLATVEAEKPTDRRTSDYYIPLFRTLRDSRTFSRNC